LDVIHPILTSPRYKAPVTDSASDPRPRSAVSDGTGLAGLAGLFVWVAVARVYGMSGPYAALTAVAACGVPMVLWSVLVDAQHAGELGEPLVTEVEPAALPLLEDKGSPLSLLLPPQTQAAGWAALSLLLGSVAVEVFGHMPPCDSTTAAAVFRMKTAVARRLVGLPDPR